MYLVTAFCLSRVLIVDKQRDPIEEFVVNNLFKHETDITQKTQKSFCSQLRVLSHFPTLYIPKVPKLCAK